MARTKRPDDGGESREDESGCSEAGHNISHKMTTMRKHPRNTLRAAPSPRRDERRFRELISFLRRMVKELNEISSEGGAVLVEGKRDVAALKGLGYSGPIFSVSMLASSGASRQRLREDVRQVIILTDLDAEGRRLASRYVKFLAKEGVKASLAQRKRLSEASRGVFLYIENLKRFALDDDDDEDQPISDENGVFIDRDAPRGV